MINIKDASEFEQLLKALSDDVVDAHIHYQMYEDLVEAIGKHPLVVHQSNTFWTFTLQAHLNSCVYALFRAYDQDTRALHLRSWLTTIQENLHLFDEASFRERLKENPYVASLAKDSRKPDAATLADDIAACSSTDLIVKRLTVYRAAMQQIVDALETESEKHYVHPYNMAKVFGSLGDKEQTFGWLEKAYDEHSPDFIELRTEPTFDSARFDPRFSELLSRVGLNQI